MLVAKRAWWCVLAFLPVVVLLYSCDEDSSESFEEDDDDTTGNDQVPDDDLDDDSAMAPDDDTGTADDDMLSAQVNDAPILSNGHWDPPELTIGTFVGYPEDMWYSTFSWSVCDLFNDLMPDGVVYFYTEGIDDIFMPVPPEWAEFHDPPEVDLTKAGDCVNPVEVVIIILFGPESSPPAPGDHCVDIEATDNERNYSNLLEKVCVFFSGL